MLLAMLTSVVLAASEPASDEPLVPFYVPRSVKLGTFINAPAVSPNIRLVWEGAILEQPRNMLMWTASLGSAIGLNLQSPMTAHYQHVVLAGAGYRSDRQLIFWGFQVSAGPVWYRAAYKPGSVYQFENRVLGYIEGRLQLGVKLAPHFRLAAYFGYASPFTFQRQYPGNIFVGGVDVGVVVDWR